MYESRSDHGLSRVPARPKLRRRRVALIIGYVAKTIGELGKIFIALRLNHTG